MVKNLALVLAPDPAAAGLSDAQAQEVQEIMRACGSRAWCWRYAGGREEIAQIPEPALPTLQAYAQAIGADAPHLVRHAPASGVFLPEAFDVRCAAGSCLLATSAVGLADELDALNQRLGICHHFEDDYYAQGDWVRLGQMILRDAATFALARKLPLVLHQG